MYAATTKDEGNAADGRFSKACQGLTLLPLDLSSSQSTLFDKKDTQ
jgi:hypothetical protein